MPDFLADIRMYVLYHIEPPDTEQVLVYPPSHNGSTAYHVQPGLHVAPNVVKSHTASLGISALTIQRKFLDLA